MNTKKAVTTILIAILTSMAISAIIPMHARAAGVNPSYVTFSDAYLSNTTEWGITYYEGGAPTVSITDLSGPGVQFDLGNVGTKVEVGDNYPVAIPGLGDNLTGFGGYELYLKNLGSAGVNAHLYMNTGYTGSNWKYDTFWGGNWIWLNPGETKLCTLNFSYAQAWNIADDPDYPLGTFTDGNWYPVLRLNEVTNIGFEVLGSGTLNLIALGSLNPELYVDPSTVNKAPINNDTTFTVDVVIKNFTDFYAFDIKMTWDSSLLRYESAAYTDKLDTLWGTDPGWNVVQEAHTVGSYKLVATKLGTGGVSSTNAYILFTITLRIIKTSNFPLQCAIHFDTVKLSDSDTPIPNPIIPKTLDGMYYMGSKMPDLEFELVDPNPLKHFEICKIFEVKVYATHIFANLKDYDLTILYNAGHLKCVDVDYWGVLGDNVTGQADYAITTGSVHVWDLGGVSATGDRLWLFTLTFHVEFSDHLDPDITHIWRKNGPYIVTADIQLDSAQLSFLEGTIGMGGITMPPALVTTINLIRGDVNCDGVVNIDDISTLAYYYEKVAPVKYDLNEDGIIDVYDIVVIATNYGYGM